MPSLSPNTAAEAETKARPRICTFGGCGRPSKNKSGGLCPGHAKQQRLGWTLRPLRPSRKRERIVLPERPDGNPDICRFPGCDKPRFRRQHVCTAHYEQRRRGERLRPLRVEIQNQGKTCSYSLCDRPAYVLGLCIGHYKQRTSGRALHPISKWRLTARTEAELAKLVAYIETEIASEQAKFWPGLNPLPLGREFCDVHGCYQKPHRLGVCERHLRETYGIRYVQTFGQRTFGTSPLGMG